MSGESEDMREDMRAALARLSVHEFLLEVLFANRIAPMTATEAEAFFNALTEAGGKSYGALMDDSPVGEANRRSAEMSKAMVERFAQKVRERVAAREQRARGLSPRATSER